MNFDVPSPRRDIDQDGMFDRAWYTFFNSLRQGVVRNTQSGSTAERPVSGGGLEIGMRYYDTTLGKPIFVHQVKPVVVWHDAAGGVV